MNHEFDSNLGTTDGSNAGAGTSQKIPRGTVVGRYVIIEIIDSGGMGSVYRVRVSWGATRTHRVHPGQNAGRPLFAQIRKVCPFSWKNSALLQPLDQDALMS